MNSKWRTNSLSRSLLSSQFTRLHFLLQISVLCLWYILDTVSFCDIKPHLSYMNKVAPLCDVYIHEELLTNFYISRCLYTIWALGQWHSSTLFWLKKSHVQMIKIHYQFYLYNCIKWCISTCYMLYMQTLCLTCNSENEQRDRNRCFFQTNKQ